MNTNEEKFSIVVSSDLDYEKLVVYLNFNNNQVITMNSDKGENSIEIEIFDKDRSDVIWKFDYFEFIKWLNLANKKLKEINENFPS